MDTPRRSRPRGAATKDALVRAALTVIERDGTATTRSIAKEAGVPLGTVHYWFAGTDDLYAEVIDTLLRQVRDEVDATADDLVPGDRLQHAYDRLIQLPQGRQLALFEVTMRAVRDPALAHLARGQYEAYRVAAQDSMSRWKDEIDDRLPGGRPALATLIVALTDGLTLGTLADPDGTKAEAAIALFAYLLEAAGVTANSQ